MTNVLGTYNVALEDYHGRGNFDRGRMLASGFDGASVAPSHQAESFASDRRRALAARKMREAALKGYTHVATSGANAGRLIQGPGDPGDEAREVRVDDIAHALHAEERKARKIRQHRSRLRAGMKEGRHRIVINSSGRDRPGETTSSDFVVSLDKDALPVQAYGFEIIGWSIPITKWTVEPYENAVPFRLGRPIRPGARQIACQVVVREREGGRDTAAGARIVGAEIPLAWNPIVQVAPVVRGAGARGVRVRCAYRVGHFLREFAEAHAQAGDGAALRIVSMPKSLPTGVADAGYGPNAGGHSACDDFLRLQPRLIVSPAAPVTDAAPSNRHGGGGSLPAEPESPLLASTAGQSVIPRSQRSISSQPRRVPAAAVPDRQDELFYMDADLSRRLFGDDPAATDDEDSYIDCVQDRAGVPFGWLAARTPATRADVFEVAASMLARALRPFGYFVQTGQDGNGDLMLTTSWPRVVTPNYDREGDDAFGGEIGAAWPPIQALYFDDLGPMHMGLDRSNSPRQDIDMISSTSIVWSATHVRDTFDGRQAVHLHPGPMKGGLRELAHVVQKAVDSCVYQSMTFPSHPTFAIPVTTNTRQMHLVHVVAGRYSPAGAAAAMQAALRDVFPGFGFEVSAQPTGFSFRAKRTFSLRFDVAAAVASAMASSGALDADTPPVINPDALGYMARAYTGSDSYEPMREDSVRSGPGPGACVGDAGFGTLTPWPCRIRVGCDPESRVLTFDAEPFARMVDVEVMDSRSDLNLVLLRTKTAHRLPEASRVRIIPDMSGDEAAQERARAEAAALLATVRDLAQVLSAAQSQDVVAADLGTYVAHFVTAWPQDDGGHEAGAPADAAAMRSWFHDAMAAAASLRAAMDANADAPATLTVEAVWDSHVLRLLSLWRAQVLRRATADVSMTARVLSATEPWPSLQGPAAVPYGITAADAAQGPQDARSLLLSVSEPIVVYADEQEGDGDAPHVPWLIDDHAVIFAMAPRFIVEPMLPDTTPVVLDMRAELPSRVDETCMGLMRREYVVHRPGAHLGTLESERDADLSHPMYVMIMVDVNVPHTSVTTVHDMLRPNFNGLPKDIINPTGAGDYGSLYIISGTADGGAVSTRCTAYLPLGDAVNAHYDARSTRSFDAPVQVNNVRATVMLPDGRLYPMHGRNANFALRFVTVSQAVPEESEQEDG